MTIFIHDPRVRLPKSDCLARRIPDVSKPCKSLLSRIPARMPICWPSSGLPDLHRILCRAVYWRRSLKVPPARCSATSTSGIWPHPIPLNAWSRAWFGTPSCWLAGLGLPTRLAPTRPARPSVPILRPSSPPHLPVLLVRSRDAERQDIDDTLGGRFRQSNPHDCVSKIAC